MKPTERDELLGRLDERTEHIFGLAEKQEKHLTELNRRTAKSELNIDRNHNRIVMLENLAADGFRLKLSRKQVVGGGTGIFGVIAVMLITIGQYLGWW